MVRAVSGSRPRERKVEEFTLIELTGGGAMGAFDVVRVDLKLRLGVDLGIRREEKIVVGLIGVGLLSGLMHVDLASERRPGATIEHAFVILIAHAVGCGVVYLQDIVDVLAGAREVEAVELRLDLRAVQACRDLVSDEAAAERCERLRDLGLIARRCPHRYGR